MLAGSGDTCDKSALVAAGANAPVLAKVLRASAVKQLFSPILFAFFPPVPVVAIATFLVVSSDDDAAPAD